MLGRLPVRHRNFDLPQQVHHLLRLVLLPLGPPCLPCPVSLFSTGTIQAGQTKNNRTPNFVPDDFSAANAQSPDQVTGSLNPAGPGFNQNRSAYQALRKRCLLLVQTPAARNGHSAKPFFPAGAEVCNIVTPTLTRAVRHKGIQRELAPHRWSLRFSMSA